MKTVLLISSCADLLELWEQGCREFSVDLKVYAATTASEGEKLLFGGEHTFFNVLPDFICIDTSDEPDAAQHLVSQVRANNNLYHVPVVAHVRVDSLAPKPDVGTLVAANSMIMVDPKSPAERSRFTQSLRYWMGQNLTPRFKQHTTARRVMVVDDQPLSQRWLAMALDSLGINPVIVSSGAEALKWQREEPFTIVFTDLIMPEMNGYELAQQLHEFYPDTVLVAVTGSPEKAEFDKVLRSGFRAFLVKGAAKDSVFEVLQNCGFDVKRSNS